MKQLSLINQNRLEKMIDINVKKTDNGFLPKLLNRAKKMTSKVDIGYFGNKRHGKKPITVKQVATFHEFGTRKMPKRAFIRPALTKNRKSYLQIVGGQIKPTLLGKQSSSKAWQLVGEKAVKDIQNYITQGKFTPISKATAQRKGTRVPLIETAQMHDEIDYRVKDRK